MIAIRRSGRRRTGRWLSLSGALPKTRYKDYERDDETQPVSTWVTRSGDGGKTWSEPSEIDVRDIGYGSPYGKMLTLPDGTMLMNIYGHEVREAGGKSAAKVDHSYLYRSSDHGRTWERHALDWQEVQRDWIAAPAGRHLVGGDAFRRDRQCLAHAQCRWRPELE